MPALDNIRHERFARAWIKTGIAAEAYRRAGYKADRPRSVWTNAWRMLRHEGVSRRIRELKKQMASRNRITVDSLIEELDEAKQLASRIEQPATVVSAILAKARLTGLLVDRKESGEPGAFAGLQSEADVLATVRSELGDAAAEQLQAALGKVLEAGLDEPAELADEPIAPITRTPSDTLN